MGTYRCYVKETEVGTVDADGSLDAQFIQYCVFYVPLHTITLSIAKIISPRGLILM